VKQKGHHLIYSIIKATTLKTETRKAVDKFESSHHHIAPHLRIKNILCTRA